MATSNGAPRPSVFNTTLPSTSSPRVHNIQNFQIRTQKLPILKAGPIEEMTHKLGIAPPEMIFGDNYVSIQHGPSNWSISFSAFGALDRVDKTGERRLKVAYSREWAQSREDSHDITEVVKPFDWSYSTDFRGETTGPKQWKDTDAGIPLELLKRPDPILFFDDVVLYEDELADNGIAMLSVKIRVMPQRLLLLQRFFMRLDGVLVRLRDTRVYVDFGQEKVIREYVARERGYEELVKRELAGRRDDVAAVLRDPNQLVELLPVVERKVEEVFLGG